MVRCACLFVVFLSFLLILFTLLCSLLFCVVLCFYILFADSFPGMFVCVCMLCLFFCGCRFLSFDLFSVLYFFKKIIYICIYIYIYIYYYLFCVCVCCWFAVWVVLFLFIYIYILCYYCGVPRFDILYLCAVVCFVFPQQKTKHQTKLKTNTTTQHTLQSV